MQQLQTGSTLQSGKYKILDTLGQGGFGITYLAENTMLDGKVAIKEFFFKEYCNRDEETSHVTIPTDGNREIVERFKMKFIKEARTIFKLNHPNIIRILDVFEENDTAYYVMDYIEGESLGDMVKRRGAIPETEAIAYIKEVGSALTYIHGKNMNHLDIKPSNLMKRKDNNKIQVIDFGVAKQYDITTSEGTTTTPVGISHGYSPCEQYQKKGAQSFSPQSDVYALAATLFKLLTGNTPPEAMIVQDEGLPVEELRAKGISVSVIRAIDAAMQTRKKRTQTVAEFLKNLETKDDEATVLTVENQKAEEDRRRKEAETIRQADEKAAAERKTKELDISTKYIFMEVERNREKKENTGGSGQIDPKYKRKKIILSIVCAIIIIVLASKGIDAISGSSSSKQTEDKILKEIVNKTPTDSIKNKDVFKELADNMVYVEGGTFTMGATSEQVSSGYTNEDETPAHEVTLSSFYICKYEVTQEQWQAVMGNNPSEFKGNRKPVQGVSWDDCQIFISKLNSLTNKKYRLPTEAEWEYACRGGNRSEGYIYSGSNTLDDVAWYSDNSGRTAHEVGSKLPNELGLYDMLGNVWEWCSDWYGDYNGRSQSNPIGPNSGTYRVFRGGDCSSFYLSPSFRNKRVPDCEVLDIGFRLCLSTNSKTKKL